MRTTSTTLIAIALILAASCGGSTHEPPDGTVGAPDARAALDGATPDSAVPDASAPTDAGPPRIVRILPLGDSLTLGYGSATEGSGTEGGYRLRLAELLQADGIAFDFVGSRQNGPAALTDHDHEGYNGYAVAQVADITDAALDAHRPDVVLLMAGTNDQITFVPPSQPPAGAAEDLEDLILQIDARLPGVQIIVAQVIPLTFNDAGVTQYNALLPPLVSSLQGMGVHVRLVDMYAIGAERLSGDGIHPTVEGYARMAEIWYPALRDALAEL